MGGFLGGLGTLFGGFNTARRIDEEGFDFREAERAKQFARDRAEEEARQADENRGIGLTSEYLLGGGQPDDEFAQQAFGPEVDEARRKFLTVAGVGRGAQARSSLDFNKAYQARLLERDRQKGRIDLQDVRAEDRQEFLELDYKLKAKQPLTAAERRRFEEIRARTEMMRNRPVGGLGGEVGLTEEGLNAAARQYAATGSMPSLGMGAAGTRQAIINKAAELFPNVDIASNAAKYRAGSGALTNVTKQRTAVEAFEDTAARNSEILKDALRKIPDIGIRPLNQAARSIQTMLGDVEMAQFTTALQSVRNEYARIISNPNLVGVMSDSARREGEVLLNPNATVDQILGALDVLQAEARNRRESFGAVESDLLGSFGGGDTAPPVGASGSGTADDPFVF
jgi:hypothetical protein